MAEVIGERKASRSSRPSFFTWMAFAMAFFIFGGFSMTYFQPVLTRTGLSYPPIVHLHGFIFFSWMILLIVQPALVNLGNVKLHRSVGTFGIVVASMLILMGTLITIMFAGFSAGNPTPDFNNLMYLSVNAVIGFAVLFCLAIRNVRKIENHKRLMLFATIFLLPPGINRMYMVVWELAEAPVLWTYLTMDILVAAILIYDWRTLGRVSRISVMGATVVFIPHLLHPVMASSGFYIGVYDFLSGLYYYR